MELWEKQCAYIPRRFVVLRPAHHEHHEHYAWQGLVPRSRRAAWRQVTAVTGRPAISAVTLRLIVLHL
jgi:hypothetical protein